MAVANYHEAHGNYPPAYIVGPDGRPWHSWRVLILPFLEEDKLFKEYNFSEPWDGPNNRKLADRMPRTFAFTGARRPGNTTANYLAVVGPETVWPGAATVTTADITDASSQTILLVESQDTGIHWMEPRDLPFADMDFRINNPGSITSPYTDPAVVMLDCSVKRLLPGLQPDTLRALFTIRGGESLDSNSSGGWTLLPDGRQRQLRQP